MNKNQTPSLDMVRNVPTGWECYWRNLERLEDKSSPNHGISPDEEMLHVFSLWAIGRRSGWGGLGVGERNFVKI
jgi:hypothetical protein